MSENMLWFCYNTGQSYMKLKGVKILIVKSINFYSKK